MEQMQVAVGHKKTREEREKGGPKRIFREKNRERRKERARQRANRTRASECKARGSPD